MEVDVLKGLKRLQKEPSIPVPFKSLHDFNRWADEVHPLLAFNMYHAQNFKKARQNANSQDSSEASKHHSEHINNAIRIVNNAISVLENRQQEQPKPSWTQKLKAHFIKYSVLLTFVSFLSGAGAMHLLNAKALSNLAQANKIAMCEIKNTNRVLSDHEKVISSLVEQLVSYNKHLPDVKEINAVNKIRDDIEKENLSYDKKLKQLQDKCRI
ncbi:hypothetical protein [Hydrogenovibrio kuenenii]|uniref:hypothetical protein n=1 Tax=Hydrogenovibrio kuenenii TaxID=63658 RepID=UPI000465EFBC|nr:hypothetical protein [Hydrogenovibrio kuenenii]